MLISEAYAKAVRELEALGVMPDRPPSLEPMREALARFPFSRRIDPARVVVVAGTNGKGSVSATLDALLGKAGMRTGLYTSPHLVETTERFRLDGQDVPQELFVRAWSEVGEACRGIRLTHFEALTLMAAWLFFSGDAVPPVERAILEVGLGGLWDATNAIPHDFCVITRLGLDHQNLLGPTLGEIARNKFGIVTPGSTVVHYPIPTEARELAREAQATTGSRWIEANLSGVEFRKTTAISFTEDPTWYLTWPGAGEARLALPGERGVENSVVALTALRELGHDPRNFVSALSDIRWPGRMQRIFPAGAPCPVYVSGDHNPQGVESLLSLLPDYPARHLRILAGIGRDKDAERMLARLFAFPGGRTYLTQTPFRGRALEDYGPWLDQAAGAWADPREALAQVLARAEPGDRVLITGSLYLVGEVLSSR